MIRNEADLSTSPARETALACIAAGIEAANPVRVIGETVAIEGDDLVIHGDRYDLSAFARIIILGGGKASERVVTALEELLGDRLAGGAVVTPDPGKDGIVERMHGDHPVPSERGVKATERLLSLADGADEGTLVLAPITGGGSALMPAPAATISLDSLQSVTEALLRSGADIGEINAVRKHLSAIKGGGLARRSSPATVVGLVFSDVVGNDISVIASGPTAPDPTTFADAIDVLDRYDLSPPSAVVDRLQDGAAGAIDETPGPDDPVFDRVTNYVLADGFTALSSARDVAEERGYQAMILASGVRGEAREAAKTHVAVAEECQASENPIAPPAVLLTGGETTVTVRGDGRGGPNQEFALSAALHQTKPVTVASVDTDGLDGSTDAAGGIIDARTIDDVERARAALVDNDAYPYLEDRNGLVITGGTGTNVNDLRVMVIEQSSGV